MAKSGARQLLKSQPEFVFPGSTLTDLAEVQCPLDSNSAVAA